MLGIEFLSQNNRLLLLFPLLEYFALKSSKFWYQYYVAAQSIDPGSKASKFSQELKLELLYEWKLLNQGGIVDRYIEGKKDPILRLADLDGDDDLDLLFGSRVSDPSNSGTDSYYKLTVHKYDAEEKRMIRVDRESKTENSDKDNKNDQSKTIQEMDREKLEKKFSTEDKEKLN